MWGLLGDIGSYILLILLFVRYLIFAFVAHLYSILPDQNQVITRSFSRAKNQLCRHLRKISHSNFSCNKLEWNLFLWLLIEKLCSRIEWNYGNKLCWLDLLYTYSFHFRCHPPNSSHIMKSQSAVFHWKLECIIKEEVRWCLCYDFSTLKTSYSIKSKQDIQSITRSKISDMRSASAGQISDGNDRSSSSQNMSKTVIFEVFGEIHHRLSPISSQKIDLFLRKVPLLEYHKQL